MHSVTCHINWLKSAGNHGSKRKTPKAASLKRVRRLWRATNVGPKNKQCASDVVVPREPRGERSRWAGALLIDMVQTPGRYMGSAREWVGENTTSIQSRYSCQNYLCRSLACTVLCLALDYSASFPHPTLE